MKLLTGLSGAEPDGIYVALWLWNQLSRVIGGETERIDDVRFQQAFRFAICGSLIAEESIQGHLSTQRGIQIALPASSVAQSDPGVAYPGHLQGDLPLMELVVTGFTQRQQVRQRILSTMFPIRDMMGLQVTVQFSTLLAPIAVPHQAGDARLFRQKSRILVLTTFQFRVV